jgi:ketosteroid isomerase-like protein
LSQANVDFVRGLLQTVNPADKDAILARLPELVPEAFTEDAVWEEDPQRADQRVWQGHDGILESFQVWMEQWDKYSFEVRGIEDHGDKVFVAAREEARGGASGVSVAAHNLIVLTLRDGKVARYQELHDENAARDELF